MISSSFKQHKHAHTHTHTPTARKSTQDTDGTSATQQARVQASQQALAHISGISAMLAHACPSIRSSPSHSPSSLPTVLFPRSPLVAPKDRDSPSSVGPSSNNRRSSSTAAATCNPPTLDPANPVHCTSASKSSSRLPSSVAFTPPAYPQVYGAFPEDSMCPPPAPAFDHLPLGGTQQQAKAHRQVSPHSCQRLTGAVLSQNLGILRPGSQHWYIEKMGRRVLRFALLARRQTCGAMEHRRHTVSFWKRKCVKQERRERGPSGLHYAHPFGCMCMCVCCVQCPHEPSLYLPCSAILRREWSAWVGVEGRSQQAMSLMGKVRAQLAALQSLDAARHK